MAGNDIAMNEFQIVTDTTYIYGEKNSNQNKIAVEDLKTIMGIYTYDFTLEAGEEKDLGNLGFGMYLLASPSMGVTAIYICGSYTKCFVSDGGGVQHFSDYSDTTKYVVFGRKELNGNFFIKNNRNNSMNLRMKRIYV